MIESRFKHNQEVVVNFGKAGLLSGQIDAIKFTESKVYYDVIILPFADNEYPQVLKEVDSYFVESPEDRFNGKSNIGLIDTKN